MQVPLIYVLVVIIFMIAVVAKDIGITTAIALIAAVWGTLIALSNAEGLENPPKTPPPKPDLFGEVDPATLPWRQQNPIGYSRDAMINQGQTDTYTMCYEPVRPIVTGGDDIDSSADGMMALLNQARSRDKRVSDAVALKDASFYRYYYDDELALNENKPWWGQDEY